MGDLILDSLEIRGFRCFNHLQIERLGRVNLIVGKNNVGKTSLLEALQLYANKGDPTLIWELLQVRDESTYNLYRRSARNTGTDTDVKYLLSQLKYLFYGRKDIKTFLEPILIGPMNSSNDKLSITVEWYARQKDENESIKFQLLQPEEYDMVDNPVPRFTILIGKQQRSHPLAPNPSIAIRDANSNCIFIPSDGLEREQIGEFWGSVALRELENDVLTALRIVAPGVQRLSLIGDPGERFVGTIDIKGRYSVPIVRIEGIDEPIPLRGLGDGMQRILGIALALVNARDGMLLIDEIENGLHYSVQPDLWRLIFQLAHRLNVQVFATTHSWDCIEAFQEAAQEDHQEEGLLIRLQSKNGEITATLFDERKLTIATRELIEVR